MNFKVRLSKAVRRIIRSWEKPVEFKVEFLKRVQRDLGELPRLNGYKATFPVRFHTHRIVMKCPETGQTHRFLIWVDDCERVEGTRTLIEYQEITSRKPYAGMRPAVADDSTTFLPPANSG